MKRPFLMRRLSGRLRRSAFSRLYLPQATDKKWRDLFVGASLDFAPGVNVDLLASDFMHAAIAFTGEYEHGLSHRVVASEFKKVKPCYIFGPSVIVPNL
jgi:hypothetical protein